MKFCMMMTIIEPVVDIPMLCHSKNLHVVKKIADRENRKDFSNFRSQYIYCSLIENIYWFFSKKLSMSYLYIVIMHSVLLVLKKSYAKACYL